VVQAVKVMQVTLELLVKMGVQVVLLGNMVA
jgi:hypothetical protein